jgi:hypothetical protein
VGSYLDIQGDPDEISARGSLLGALGSQLQAKTQAILANIQGIEAGAPWGTDSYGKGFHDTYYGTPNGDQPTFRESLEDQLNHAGDDLEVLGDKTAQAMGEYKGADTQSASELNNSGPA